jgi:hypothetical protein
MRGPRHKLLFCFGGVLALLLVAWGWRVGVMRRHDAALQAYSAGAHRGAEYASAMADAIDELDAAAERALEPNADEPAVRRAAGEALAAFERNFAAVRGRNATPGPEVDRAATAIAGAWLRYAVAVDTVLDQYKPRAERQEALGVLAAESPRIRRAAREIESLDRRDRAERDDRARQATSHGWWAAYTSIVAGAVLFVIVLVAWVLQQQKQLGARAGSVRFTR